MSPKIRAVYLKELRDSLRDRRTIFASVFIPLLIWPVMLLGMVEVTQMAQARLSREVYTVAVPTGTKDFFETKLNAAQDENAESLKGVPGLSPSSKTAKLPMPAGKNKATGKPEKPTTPTLKFVEMPPDESATALNEGKINAVVVLPADFEARVAGRQNAEVKVKFDQAENRSVVAYNRLESMFDRYMKTVVKSRLDNEKLTTGFLNPFEYKTENVAKPAKVGGSVMGMFLPMIFIMMLITGAIYPAIDMTAGEKERSTLETLIGSPVRPIEIITGKFLAVSTLAMGNAVLNVASCGATFAMLPDAQSANFQFPWSALPLTLLLLIPLALFFSALLLAVASFAANHKEAQIYCLPIYLIPVVGMAMVMMPGLELEGPLLIVPVLNTTLLIKELFLSHGTALQVVYVFVSTCFYAAAAVVLASRVFAREEILFSAQGSLRLFLSRRFFKPFGAPRPGDSLLVAALLFPVNFYFQLWLSKMLLDPAEGLDGAQFSLLVVLPQYLLFLAFPIAAAWYLKLDMKKTFLWRKPELRAMLAALCLGCGSWLVCQQLSAWQSHFWEYTSGDMEVIERPLREMSKTNSGVALLIFLIGLTPGLCEEHFFRGFLQQGLRSWRKWAALITVGAIFAAYHFPLYRQPVVMIMGITLAYVAYESASIWPGVFFHFLHNSLSMVGPTLLKMSDEKPVPGQPLRDVPLQFLLPAAALFVAGLVLVRKRQHTLPQRSFIEVPSESKLT